MGKHKETLWDMVKYERELGNNDIADQILQFSRDSHIDLHKITGDMVKWVSNKRKVAERYGPVEQVYLPYSYVIIAEDGEDGYLVLPARYTIFPKYRK